MYHWGCRLSKCLYFASEVMQYQTQPRRIQVAASEVETWL